MKIIEFIGHAFLLWCAIMFHQVNLFVMPVWFSAIVAVLLLFSAVRFVHFVWKMQEKQ